MLQVLLRGIGPVFDDSDVSGGHSWRDIPFGSSGQYFELALIPTALEWPAPRPRKMALAHELSLGAGLKTRADLLEGTPPKSGR